jgi:hypothetical protein
MRLERLGADPRALQQGTVVLIQRFLVRKRSSSKTIIDITDSMTWGVEEETDVIHIGNEV